MAEVARLARWVNWDSDVSNALLVPMQLKSIYGTPLVADTAAAKANLPSSCSQMLKALEVSKIFELRMKSFDEIAAATGKKNALVLTLATWNIGHSIGDRPTAIWVAGKARQRGFWVPVNKILAPDQSATPDVLGLAHELVSKDRLFGRWLAARDLGINVDESVRNHAVWTEHGNTRAVIGSGTSIARNFVTQAGEFKRVVDSKAFRSVAGSLQPQLKVRADAAFGVASTLAEHLVASGVARQPAKASENAVDALGPKPVEMALKSAWQNLDRVNNQISMNLWDGMSSALRSPDLREPSIAATTAVSHLLTGTLAAWPTLTSVDSVSNLMSRGLVADIHVTQGQTPSLG